MLDKLINLCYGIAIGSVFVARHHPQLGFLLRYGKTLQSSSNNSFLHKLYVPKSWFTDFYLLDQLLATANILLIVSGKTIFSLGLPSWIVERLYPPSETISKKRFVAVTALNLLQSSRRVYECFFVSKFSSKSKIHFSHYLVGLFFYTSINLQPLLSYTDPFSSAGMPEFSVIIALFIYLFASFDQYRNHKHLSQLVKYNRPKKGLFRYVCCAHYFDEILIYFCYALILGTKYSLLILLWVIIDLSVSADETFKFYIDKEKTKKPEFQRIIPFLY